ncbi:MAG: hypothetical protein OK452_08850 [Thaumarchaeota archaeon]|nr:hypothetical protein [Nitrososphaerota archaeon]
MRKSQSVAIVMVFTALIVGSDYVLAGIANVKLLDSLAFLAAYLFGFRIGASVGILSEFIWAYATPWGAPGYIAPFLIVGEVIYALAGSAASRIWAKEQTFLSGKSVALGGLLAICALVWDLETEFGTALIAFWPSVTVVNYAATVLVGLPFTLAHEVSDFLFGMLLVPTLILMIPRLGWTRRFEMRPILAEKKD